MNQGKPGSGCKYTSEQTYHEGGVHGAQVFYYGDSAEGKEGRRDYAETAE